jgi:hypothetical protein
MGTAANWFWSNIAEPAGHALGRVVRDGASYLLVV